MTGSIDSKENREPATQLMIPRGNGTLKQLTRGQTKKGADRYAEPNSDDDEAPEQGKSAFWSGSIDISKGSASGEGAAPPLDKMIKRRNVLNKK